MLMVIQVMFGAGLTTWQMRQMPRASRLWKPRASLRHAHFLLRYAYDPRAFRGLAHLGPLRLPHLGPLALRGLRIWGPCAFRARPH